MKILAPRSITNLTIETNSTTAIVNWDIQDGSMLKVDLVYVLQSL